MTKVKKTYGLWSSPLTEAMLAGEARLSDVQWAGDGETLVWYERRDGKGAVKVGRPRAAARAISDGLNIRGGVGYGGGEFFAGGEEVYFCADGRVYRADLDKGQARALTPKFGSVAAPAASREGKRVAYVHNDEGVDRIGVVDGEGKSWPVIGAGGGDFYMQPAWSPDGTRLAWIRWDHPQMPWNGTFLEWRELRVEGETPIFGEVEVLAGGEAEAVQQPTFSPDGTKLAYLSDRSGDWQIYVRDLKSGEEERWSKEGQEYGGPAWIQGLRYFGWLNDEEIIALAAREGMNWVERVTVKGVEKLELFSEYTWLEQLAVSPKGKIALIGQSSQTPPRVVSASLDDGEERVVAMASTERLGREDLSTARVVSWPVGKGGVDRVYGLLYEPTNRRFESDGLPPALVMIHGGPTTQRTARWEARNQYFASRGFAVLDVNYRGSTGYGREYMEALFGEWGVADVEDAVGAAHFLAAEGLADQDKIVVMGGSAGGYTVLQSLVTHPGVFKAGLCLYGISDLFALQMGTHKFEAYYNDTLIGPLPEAADLYRERSPIFKAEKISDALAIYHGAQDKVVPLDQAEAIVNSLRRRGVSHLYQVYEEEGHGWRREKTIEHFHRSVLEFLKKEVIFS